MDNQKLKKFLTENTKRTAVLRIPGIILILGSVIMAFMPGIYIFLCQPGDVYCRRHIHTDS